MQPPAAALGAGEEAQGAGCGGTEESVNVVCAALPDWALLEPADLLLISLPTAGLQLHHHQEVTCQVQAFLPSWTGPARLSPVFVNSSFR